MSERPEIYQPGPEKGLTPIGRVIADFIRRNDLTQRKFSQLAGLDDSTLSLLMSGKKIALKPGFSMIAGLARALEKPLDEVERLWQESIPRPSAAPVERAPEIPPGLVAFCSDMAKRSGKPFPPPEGLLKYCRRREETGSPLSTKQIAAYWSTEFRGAKPKTAWTDEMWEALAKIKLLER